VNSKWPRWEIGVLEMKWPNLSYDPSVLEPSKLLNMQGLAQMSERKRPLSPGGKQHTLLIGATAHSQEMKKNENEYS